VKLDAVATLLGTAKRTVGRKGDAVERVRALKERSSARSRWGSGGWGHPG